jgi:hypothetical protein
MDIDEEVVKRSLGRREVHVALNEKTILSLSQRARARNVGATSFFFFVGQKNKWHWLDLVFFS